MLTIVTMMIYFNGFTFSCWTKKKCPSPANNWSVRCNNYAQSVSTSFYWFQKRRASSEWPYAIYLDSFAKIFWCQNFLSVNMKPLLNYVNFFYLVLAKLSLNGDLDSIYMRGEFMLQTATERKSSDDFV